MTTKMIKYTHYTAAINFALIATSLAIAKLYLEIPAGDALIIVLLGVAIANWMIHVTGLEAVPGTARYLEENTDD